MSLHPPNRASLWLAVALASIAGLVGLWLLEAPGPAVASTNQLALFEEDVGSDPEGTLSTLHSLGVSAVRLGISWQAVAPDPMSHTRPNGFDATNPSAYRQAGWERYDRILTDAQSQGIAIFLTVGSAAPLWATGPGQPSGGPYPQWKPSPGEYGQFVQAVGTRYSGSYRPCPSCAPLPRVNLWEVWNEPNWGPALAPQAVNRNKTPTSPGMYRGLLDAGWSALQRTGHGPDTIIMGSLSPRGFNAPPSPKFPQGLPGYFSTTKPLQFVRNLYCVDSQYRRLRGSSAAAVGCPSTTAASNKFRSQHPALFGASGFGVHPYPFSLPPNQADSSDPDYVEFSQIPRLESALDRAQRVYGSSKRMLIYNTEYGYETNPPNASDHFVSPPTAAYYINWAEYLSWRNPRIANTMQYLLYDPNPTAGQKVYGHGSFATGLIFYHGGPKADYYAYRMPLFLPVTSARRGQALEVWGCVRPAPAYRDPLAQQAAIQFRSGSGGAFNTIKTVTITSPHGYFDIRLALPSSGAVRVAWTPPSNQTMYSRTVAVTVR